MKSITCKECNKKISFLDLNNNPVEPKAKERRQFGGYIPCKRNYYEIDIEVEIERRWNNNKFSLCVNCWDKKKEGYKSLVRNLEDPADIKNVLEYDYWKDKGIKVCFVVEHFNSDGSVDLAGCEIGNCLTCKKWNDGEERDYWGGYCSLDCKKNFKNNNKPNREREGERERESKMAIPAK